MRIVVFDFSSTFSTDQPVRLAEELSVMQVGQDLRAWIMD